MKIITPTTITLFGADFKPVVVTQEHPHWDAIYDHALHDEIEDALELADLRQAVSSYVQGTGIELDWEAGVVTIDGGSLPPILEERIFDMMSQGSDAEALVNFWGNLKANPSYRAVQELYGFLESANLPLTPDGHFVAYKMVSHAYTDKHSGTFDNSVGSVCEMPRNTVDEDKNRTCSSGLHFAAYEYASTFGSGHLMAIKINPKDVVAIPSDYNNQKGRACRYEVIAEVDGDVLRDTPVYISDYLKWCDSLDECCQDSIDEGGDYCTTCGRDLEY